MLKKKITYFIYALALTAAYFAFTLNMFQNAGGNLLVATFWNLGFIAIAIVTEKVEEFFLLKLKSKYDEGVLRNGLVKFIIKFFVDGASVKSVLYLFYVGILICSAIVAADPNFPYLRDITDYLQSMRYGLLILVAADKFTDQLFKDVARVY